MSNKGKERFKNWSTDVPKTLKYPQIPLHGLLEQTAKNNPEKVAMVFGEKEISYTEIDSFSNQFANALRKLGMVKGDRLALYLPNIPQFIIAYFGALKAGAVLTAISPLHREREIEYQLCNSGAQTIITTDTLYTIVEKIREKTPLKHIIIAGFDEYNSKNLSPQGIAKTLSFQKLLKNAPNTRTNLKFDSAEDLAVIQYTGGTTGTAKGAMLTHYNLLSNAIAFGAMIKGASQDVFLTALPLFHIYGMTTSLTVPISLGAKMVLLPKFEVTKACEAITRHNVTVFCGVPTMYQMLLANPNLSKYDLTSIRICISGASSLPPQVQRLFMAVTGGFLAEGYGLTEASPVTHCTPVQKGPQLSIGSIGIPLPDTEAKIVDLETGQRTLGVGEVGELAVKGPQVMKGYWCQPTETALVIRGGWLLTGDIAHMDSEGYYYITDRKKEIIKHKDFSVYPRELEDILYEHPMVKMCAVVGIPDAASGEVPKAFVVLKEGAVASKEELIAFVNEQVAPYKAIHDFEFRSELPLSGAGKVLKRQL